MATMVKAEPEPIELDWRSTALIIIDMQRDFIEPGGFGSSLGNDVSKLRRAIEPCQALLTAARRLGMMVIHTREGHRADLSDAHPAKVLRGKPSTRIGAEGPGSKIDIISVSTILSATIPTTIMFTFSVFIQSDEQRSVH